MSTLQTDFQTRLASISSRLHHLLALRTAFAPFQAALKRHISPIPEGWERRQLLSLWRPCQTRLDLLLDHVPLQAEWAIHLDLLRQELEGNLVDDTYSPGALADVASGFEQACEMGLLQLERELRTVVLEGKALGGGEEGDTP